MIEIRYLGVNIRERLHVFDKVKYLVRSQVLPPVYPDAAERIRLHTRNQIKTQVPIETEFTP